jgi:PAS domain S-box-containing protein
MSLTTEYALHDIILDSIADGVFTVDEDWRVTSFNRAAEEMTGISREDALGRFCREVLCADACGAGCSLQETFRTGRPIVDRPLHFLLRDGRRVSASVSTSVLKGPDGQVLGGVVTIRDLSQAEVRRRELRDKYTFAGIIGRSPAMQRLFHVLPRFADSNSTVLIEGPSGTGKELFARAMHQLSPRHDKPFIAVNCGALPDTLLESELFGYKAGAFTDARQDKPGRFSLAHGGTIFLDEIGDVSTAMQTKLLRVLQERVFEPLGSVESVRADVRVITATNRDLGTLVRQGSFREDLYYRINIVRMQLPGLGDRREDIPLLIDHFVDTFNRSQSKRVIGVADEVLGRLMAYEFPGNVRELENIIEYAFVLCHGGLIESRHLPPMFREAYGDAHPVQRSGSTLRDLETLHIVDALRRNNGNRTAAARELGINPSTLFRKIKSLGIRAASGNGRRPKRHCH